MTGYGKGCARGAQRQGFGAVAGCLSHLDEACLVSDAERRIVWINRAFERLFGYRPDEILGKTTRVLRDIRQDEPWPPGAPSGRATTTERSGGLVDYRMKSGGTLRCDSIRWELKDGEGHVTGHAEIIRDMGQVPSLHDVLTRLYEISSSQKISGPEKIEAILRTGCEHFRLPTAVVAMIRGDLYTVLYSHSTIAEFGPGTQYALADTICGRTILAEGPVALHETGIAAGAGIAAYIGVPLIVEGERIGTLSFSSPLPRLGFGQQDLDLVKLFAAWVAQEIGLEKAQARLSQAAALDWLTRTGTRQIFQSDIEAAHAGFLARDERSSLILFDIDRFKSVNDRFGHVAGDAVLRAVSEAARAVLPAGAEMYRLGGDEFAILAPNCDPRGAVDLAERLRVAIAGCEGAAGEGGVSASFGTATLNPDMADAQAWVQRADAALYASKHKGRDQVTCASQTNVLDLLCPDRCRALCGN